MIGYSLYSPTNVLDGLLARLNERWAIVDAKSGSEAVVFTSFLSCDVRNESTSVSSQVEEGSFASYNKVDSPREINVRLGIQGSDAELKDALDALDELRKSTKLVNLVMPAVEYRDLSLDVVNFSIKTEQGRGVLFVDLTLREIRQVTMQYSNEKIPQQKQKGKVQGTDKGKVQDAGSGSGGAGGTDAAEKKKLKSCLKGTYS